MRSAWLGFLALAACAGSIPSTPPDASTDRGTVADVATIDAALVDTGSVESDATGNDGGFVVNGCSSFVDHTAPADPRTIVWDYTIQSNPSHCTKVSAGQSVTWVGNLSDHPLLPQGGDSPSPIASADGGMATFPEAGAFGFVCQNHAFMTGAILVVP
jgi:plastocyanin